MDRHSRDSKWGVLDEKACIIRLDRPGGCRDWWERSSLPDRCLVTKAERLLTLAVCTRSLDLGSVPSYSAAKGAIVQLTKSMAIELAPHNIQVNAIAPGWIETDMTAPVRTMPMNDEILARTPAGRWGKPDELAGTAVYLASRASDFVTGTTIRVDGGYAIR